MIAREEGEVEGDAHRLRGSEGEESRSKEIMS